jgi:hypothetical protein
MRRWSNEEWHRFAGALVALIPRSDWPDGETYWEAVRRDLEAARAIPGDADQAVTILSRCKWYMSDFRARLREVLEPIVRDREQTEREDARPACDVCGGEGWRGVVDGTLHYVRVCHRCERGEEKFAVFAAKLNRVPPTLKGWEPFWHRLPADRRVSPEELTDFRHRLGILRQGLAEAATS